MYKLTATCLFALTGVAVAGTEGSPDPGGPPLDELTVSPDDALEILMNLELAKDYADPGQIPNPDRITDHCEGSPTKQFSLPIYQEQQQGLSFSIDASGRAGIVHAQDRFGFEAAAGPTVEFFGNEVKPFELRLGAIARNTGENAIALDVLAFDQVVLSETLASTNQPIQYIDAVGWQLPVAIRNALSGSWTGTFDCDDGDPDDCNGEVSASTSVVADFAAIIVLRVNANGVESRSLASVNAYAGLQASAKWDDWWDLDVDINLSFATQIDLIHALFAGRGLIERSGDRLVVDAAGQLAVGDSMGALLQFYWDIPDWADWLPGVPSEITLPIFELPAYSGFDDWSYNCRLKATF
jgi:hypothetical protein